MPLEKLLSEYFQKPELQQACNDIDEPTSYNSPELITIILNEWENKGRNKYELFEYLDRPTLSRICRAYKIKHKGDREVLLKRIREKKLLDNSHTKIKIGGGVGVGIAVGIVLFLLSPFYIDFIDFIEYLFQSEIEQRELEEYSDVSVGTKNFFLEMARITIERLEKYVSELEEEISSAESEIERIELEQIHDRVELGILHYENGNYQEALDNYDKVLVDNPENPNALGGSALMLALLDRLEDSIENYDKLLEIEPENYLAKINNGWSYTLLEKYDEALKLFDELEKLNSEDQLVLSHKCWLLHKMHNDQGAIDYCKRVLDVDENDIRALKAHSLSLSILDEFEIALPYYERLYSMLPNDVITIINYGNTLKDSGNSQKALSVYNEGLVLFPNHPILIHNKKVLCFEHPELLCEV